MKSEILLGWLKDHLGIMSKIYEIIFMPGTVWMFMKKNSWKKEGGIF